jgi:hypothetical protein
VKHVHPVLDRKAVPARDARSRSALALGRPEIEHAPSAPVEPLPAALRVALAPSERWVREGRTYSVRCDRATQLAVGRERIAPSWPGWFAWTVRGSVGRASLRGCIDGRVASSALEVEVVARRFDGPAAQLAFVTAMVRALEREQRTNPFRDRHFEWPAARSSEEPSTLDEHALLDALSRRGGELIAALDAVRASPARCARTEQTRVLLACEPDAIDAIELAAASGRWEPSAPSATSRVLRGRAPREAWGHTLQWTTDCPENRWLRDRLAAALSLCDRPSFERALSTRPLRERAEAIETIARMRAALRDEPLASARGAVADPARAKAACDRHSAYRAALCWLDTAGPNQTLRWPFAREAASLRDAATLYEMYCFFALARGIAAALGEPLRFRSAPRGVGLARGATAAIGEDRALVYNCEMKAYSGTLRPDFALVRAGVVELVFDAKMRVRDPSLAGDHGPSEDDAARIDLDKMHAYRDALGVRAAVCVFPGARSTLFETSGARREGVRLSSLLRSNIRGIAALALAPEGAL